MRQAIQELEAAEIYFNNATTDREIDYAVYRLNVEK